MQLLGPMQIESLTIILLKIHFKQQVRIIVPNIPKILHSVDRKRVCPLRKMYYSNLQMGSSNKKMFFHQPTMVTTTILHSHVLS